MVYILRLKRMSVNCVIVRVLNGIFLAVLAIAFKLPLTAAEICDAGHMCRYPHKCCGHQCCIPADYNEAYRSFKWSVWNMWYFWFIVIFVVMSCFGGCGYWRRRRQLLLGHHPSGPDFTTVHMAGPLSFPGSSRRSQTSSATNFPPSITIPVFFSRDRGRTQIVRGTITSERENDCPTETRGAFPAPPDYSEVVSKPESYPVHNDKDELPPYPGLSSDRVLQFSGSTTNHTSDQHVNLPPYTPSTENGTAQNEVTTSRTTPPPAYQQ